MRYSSSRFFDRDENNTVVFCIFIVVLMVFTVVLMVFLLVVFMIFLLVVFVAFLLTVFIVLLLDFLEVKLIFFLVVVLVSGQSPPELELVAHSDEAEVPEVGVGELRQHVVGNVLIIKGGHQVLQALVVEECVEWTSWGDVHSAEQDTVEEKCC